MRKFLLAVVCFSFFGLAANAQFFVGTGLGLGFGFGGNYSNFNFNLGPEVGFAVDEKLDIGIGLDLGLSHEKINGIKNNTTSWEVTPFARYSVYEYKGIEVLGRVNVFVGGANSSLYTGVNFVPMIIYNLNERIELQAIADFLTLDFRIQDSHFGFDFGLETRASSPIRFGFAYKF